MFLPMKVLEELDNGKKGTSEVSRNARQVSRFLNELIEAHGSRPDRRRASPLVQPKGLQLRGADSVGRLLFPDRAASTPGQRFGTVIPDNQILGAILQLRERPPAACRWCWCPRTSTCGSRPRSAASPAEDYENDRALDDFSLLLHRRHRAAGRFLGTPRKDCARGPRRAAPIYEVQLRRRRGLVSEPVPVPARRRRGRVARGASSTARHAIAADRRRLPRTRNTRCGASTRATASRTSRSTR